MLALPPQGQGGEACGPLIDSSLKLAVHSLTRHGAGKEHEEDPALSIVRRVVVPHRRHPRTETEGK